MVPPIYIQSKKTYCHVSFLATYEKSTELLTCPYPLKIQARPPRDQGPAPRSRVSRQGGSYTGSRLGYISLVKLPKCEDDFRSGQVKSGQVRVFNVHIQSKLVPGSSVRDWGKKGGKEYGGRGVGETACTGGYKGVRAVRPESVQAEGENYFSCI